MKHYVAIDHGGTATRVILCLKSGRAVSILNDHSMYGFGERGKISWREHVGRLLCRLYNDSGICRSDCENAVLSLNGVNSPQEIQQAENDFRRIAGIRHFRVVNDSVSALRGCHLRRYSDKTEVVLCGGSGLNCAMNVGGQRVQSLGWRIAAQDQGGYAIGRRIWEAAVDAFNGLGEETILVAMLLSFYHRKSFPLLLRDVFGGHLQFATTELAGLLFEAASLNDAVAREIVNDLSKRWIGYVQLVLRERGICPASPIDLYLSGGLFFDQSGVMRTGVENFARMSPFRLRVKMASYPPVVGAALLLLDGMRQEDASDTFDEFHRSLLRMAFDKEILR